MVEVKYPAVTVSSNPLLLNYGSGGTYGGLDQFGRVVDQKWQNSTPTVKDRYKYGYDRASNRTYRENSLTHGSPPALDEFYTYDGLQRLTRAARGTLSGTPYDSVTSPVKTQDFGLEALGNWKTFKEDAGDGTSWDLEQTRTHNPVNEISGITGGSWIVPAYDAAGNMTAGPKPGAETTRIHMKYDAWNRMVKVSADDNGSPGTTIAEYRYDGRGWRIAKLIPNGENWDRTDFYYNEAWQCLEERYGANQAKETVPTSTKIQWLWSVQYIDAPVVRWRDTDDNGTLDETLYYCNDANMNVTALINTDGSIAERYVYDPYGKPTIYDDDWSDTVTWANSKKNEILYCGYRWDPESGLYNPRERYYHSTFGCMTTRDPSTRLDGAPEEANYRLILGAGRLTSIRSSEMPTYLLEYADGPSLYNYVANIPTARFDPSGLCGTVSGNTFTRDDTCCGPNITDLLSNMLQSLDTNWNNAWDWKKKNRICNGIWTPGKYQIPGGGEVNMWDVRELRNTPAEITSNVEGACPYSGECGNTVTVNGKCYDANQVNYILWGKINWLCGTKFEATIGAAAEYKLVSLGISKFKSDINFEVGHAVEALGWTTVGYMGNVTLGALVPSMHSECRVVDCKTKKQSLTPMLSEKGSSYVRYAIAAANILSDVSPLRVSPLLDPLLELQRTPSP